MYPQVAVYPKKDVAGVVASRFNRRRAPLVYVPHPTTSVQTRVLDMVVRGGIEPVGEAVHGIGRLRGAFGGVIRIGRSGEIVVSR